MPDRQGSTTSAARRRPLLQTKRLQEAAYLDEGVQLLVTTDGQLQVTGCDTLHLLQQTTGCWRRCRKQTSHSYYSFDDLCVDTTLVYAAASAPGISAECKIFDTYYLKRFHKTRRAPSDPWRRYPPAPAPRQSGTLRVRGRASLSARGQVCKAQGNSRSSQPSTSTDELRVDGNIWPPESYVTTQESNEGSYKCRPQLAVVQRCTRRAKHFDT